LGIFGTGGFFIYETWMMKIGNEVHVGRRRTGGGVRESVEEAFVRRKNDQSRIAHDGESGEWTSGACPLNRVWGRRLHYIMFLEGI
jgi:hypothetical protein